MKVIDLLNKIANNEEVPKFKYYGGTYIYDKETGMYWYQSTWFDFDIKYLNDEVEIIEEEKKIPKKLGECAYVDGEIAYSWSKSEALLKTKINEIIDYLKSKGE